MEPSPWSFNLAWDEIAIVALAAGAYAVALRRYPASRPRIAAFAASLLLLLAAPVTPVGPLALE